MEKKALKVLLICVCGIILLMACIGVMTRMSLASQEIGKESPTPSSYRNLEILTSTTENWGNETLHTTQGSLETNQTPLDENSKKKVKLMGESCQVGDICTGNTKCIGTYAGDMRCKCQRTSSVASEDSKETCSMEVGGPCNPKNKDSICMALTECVSRDNRTYKCECKLGFIEKHKSDKDKLSFPYGLGCDIAFGYTCGMPGNKNRCDRKSDLICKQGTCACKHLEHVYEPGRRKCSSPVGAACKVQNSECVDNAYCKKELMGFYDNNDSWGKCT